VDKLSLAKEREIAAISVRHGRRKAGKTIVEGVRAIQTMLACGVRPEYIAVCRQVLTVEGDRFLGELVVNEAPVFDLEAKKFAQLSDTVNSQGFLAVIKTSDRLAEDILPAAARLIVYLDGISDPGNVGTIIRTAAAFAVDLVAVSPTSADPYNPKVIRASAGMLFQIPVARVARPEAFFAKLKSGKVTLVGTAPEATGTLEDYQPDKRICLAIGSEATGLSAVTRSACKSLLGIRTSPSVESLNAAAAAAIAIHQLAHKLELI
jgi:RNA methyltransferase, TrmH family